MQCKKFKFLNRDQSPTSQHTIIPFREFQLMIRFESIPERKKAMKDSSSFSAIFRAPKSCRQEEEERKIGVLRSCKEVKKNALSSSAPFYSRELLSFSLFVGIFCFYLTVGGQPQIDFPRKRKSDLQEKLTEEK